MGSIAWIIGLILAFGGGIRFLFAIAAFVGLKGANKLGTAKGDQVTENEKAMADFKQKILIYGGMALLGGILMWVFN